MLNPAYGQPCYTVTVAPGKIVEVYFGNTDFPLPGTAQLFSEGGVILRDAPDLAEPFTDDAWLDAPAQVSGLFLPMITTDK